MTVAHEDPEVGHAMWKALTAGYEKLSEPTSPHTYARAVRELRASAREMAVLCNLECDCCDCGPTVHH